MNYSYTYKGEIYTEKKRFRAFRSRALEQIFADGDWRNLIFNHPELHKYDKTDDRSLMKPIMNYFQPDDFGQAVNCREVSITIKNGNEQTILNGGVYRNRASQGKLAILFLSGSGLPLNALAKPVFQQYFSQPMISAHVKTVIGIDYRGFGLSRGEADDFHKPAADYKPRGPYLPTAQGIYTDASAMIEFATAARSSGGLGVPPRNLILHGYSLGSAPAVEMSKMGKPHGGLILHSPIKSTSQQTKSAVKIPGLGKLAGAIAQDNVNFKNRVKMRDISVPVLIASGPRESNWSGAKALWRELEKRDKNVRFAVHDRRELITDAIFQEVPSYTRWSKYGSESDLGTGDGITDMAIELLRCGKYGTESPLKLMNDFLVEVARNNAPPSKPAPPPRIRR